MATVDMDHSVNSRLAPVLPGQRIGIVAPASAPTNDHRIVAGIEMIRQCGFEVVGSASFPDADGYLSAADSERIDELNRMLQAPDVRAIFCVRGGFGSLRILDKVDLETIQSDPKIIVGYSDITAIQMSVLAATGVGSLSAAMVSTDWDAIQSDEMQQILEILGGKAKHGVYASSGLPLMTVRSGRAEGRLVGGNLSTLTRLIGTRYLPDLTGAILFLEDVGEQPYRVDGMLAHFRLAGVLDRLGGLVFGGLTDGDPPDDKLSLSLERVISDYASFVDGPVATGLPYGHFSPKTPIPIGPMARLDATRSEAHLRVTEQLVGATS